MCSQECIICNTSRQPDTSLYAYSPIICARLLIYLNCCNNRRVINACILFGNVHRNNVYIGAAENRYRLTRGESNLVEKIEPLRRRVAVFICKPNTRMFLVFGKVNWFTQKMYLSIHYKCVVFHDLDLLLYQFDIGFLVVFLYVQTINV